ncbi:MAG TPA: hypothetical protein VKB49_17215 [Candidatus Sulfotelmatobacter sp.]|nr:hypothetical protein [Candidatus Sulfotelmatobacter sp.]
MQSVKKAVLLMFLAAMFAALGAVSARAQEATVSVNVPFDFIVDQHALSAGKYDVQKQGAFVSLRGSDGKSVYALLFPGSSKRQDATPHLVFTRHGDEAFLDKIVFSVGRDFDLPHSNREKELIAAAPVSDHVIKMSQSGQ